MILPLNGPEIVLAVGVVALGAFVQGTVGFGMALVASPILLLIHPRLVPGPMLCAGLVLSTLVGIRERAGTDRGALAGALLGWPAGALLGGMTLVVVPAGRLSMILGFLVLVGVVLSAAGWHVRPRRSSVVLATALAGFMGTTASIGGPPLALVYQRAAGSRLRGTLAPVFLLGGSISLITLILFGKFGWVELHSGFVLIPGAVLGFLASRRGAAWMDQGSVRRAVLLLSGISGVAVILRGLV